MQVGQFDRSERAMTFAEMALQMHVTAAYGSDGFAYFPGCYPLDWAERKGFTFAQNGGSSMLDLYGKKNVYCDWIGQLNQFFRQIEDDILRSNHLGVETFGTYKNGFLKENVIDLPDSECIYCGELPEMLRYQSGLTVKADNQVLVSTFEREGKRRYYIVNLSTIYETEVTLQIPNQDYQVTALDGTVTEWENMHLRLGAGSGAYIIEK